MKKVTKSKRNGQVYKKNWQVSQFSCSKTSVVANSNLAMENSHGFLKTTPGTGCENQTNLNGAN